MSPVAKQMAAKQTAEQLRQQQLMFTAALRNPEKNSLPAGVSAQRLDVYHELFFNNFTGVLSSAFPVIKSLLPEAKWLDLVTGFYQQHECQTPEFPRMPQEFVDWLEAVEHPEPAFLPELALWEWTELDIALDEVEVEFSFGAEISANAIVNINPTLRLQSFDYPVHEISPDNQPEGEAAEPVFLGAWRQSDFTIDFMQLNPASAAFLQILIDEPPAPLQDKIQQFAGMLGVNIDENLTSFSLEFVKDLKQRGVVVSVSE